MKQMVNEVKIFEGHEVEVLEVNGQVLFNPYHIGECLEISADGVRKAITRMSEKQVVKLKNSDVTKIHIRKLNNAGENFLTESGVYKLVFKSHKPNAEKFTDWIADEVLPSIRQNGFYATEITKENAFIQQQLEFNQQQLEFNRKIMSKLERLESNTNIYEEFYKNFLGENSQLEERKEFLYEQVVEASELYGQSVNSILHSLYGALEKLLDINLNSYKSVYRSETGKQKVGMIEVIAANDRLYENAVRMNEYALEKF